MNTFSTILATAQSRITAAAGETTATQEALIELVVNLTNDATQHGKLTANQHYPKNQTYWSTLYVYLREAGFDLLGNGFFSLVVSHPALPERVLKVGLKKEDSAAAYTAWCRMNQGRAGVPNVYATKRSTGCYVVVLDELFPLDLEKLKEFKGFRTVAQGVNGLPFEYADDNALSALYETASSVREFFRGLAEFDLHEGNVMVDSKGNVIITDPVSYTAGNSECSSWALMDNAQALNDMKREQIAERARQRHKRNHERQQLRKVQKARNKAHKLNVARWKAKQAELLKEMDDNVQPQVLAVDFSELEQRAIAGGWPHGEGLPMFAGFIAPNIAQPDPAQVEKVLGRIRQKFAPELHNLPKRIEWDPSEPLGMKLDRMRDELLDAHAAVDPVVIKQINELDRSLDAQFLMG